MNLAVRSLGWAGDQRDWDFFTWKHDQNPFGPSPGWVACDGERIVGFRTFLRWEFQRGEERMRVVRAVDTATDPDYQGRGIFRDLTLHAVEELKTQGFDAIFNTPNEKSRPGYLKMGWRQLGRPTLGVRPSNARSAVRLLRSRKAAEKWSVPVSLGRPAAEVVANEGPCDDALIAEARSWWHTPLSTTYLSWRYCFEPLHYRAAEDGRGTAIIRVRRRGPSREVALCEWLGSASPRQALGSLSSTGDYTLAVGSGFRDGFVPLPRSGPTVTWLPLATAGVPALGDLVLRLGDLELF